jgi:hypothetical protein
MKSIREWASRQYQRLKAFCRRQAPYLILVSFLLAFFVVFFFNRVVISIHPGELGVLWRWLGGGTQIDSKRQSNPSFHVSDLMLHCKSGRTTSSGDRRPATPESGRNRAVGCGIRSQRPEAD